MDIDYIHFIGIGGIGISGLARYAQAQGIRVSGSDISISSYTKYLQSLNIPINIPHDPSYITNPSLVVHSAIIKNDNVEVQEAIKKGIPVLSRSDALKILLSKKRVFSVCGAHGKSSTTAMLASILDSHSAIIGAQSKEFGSNVRAINSSSIVFEADESDGSFLNSNPYCAIVTNAEPEHMEYYSYDIDLFHKAYMDFIEMAQLRIINAEDDFLSTIRCDAVRLYPNQDIRNISFFLCDNEPYTSFTLYNSGICVGDFQVWGFGYYTAVNASLAILASLSELEVERICINLKHYKGIKKRFDIISDDRCVIIDDYGHHPTEIKNTLDSIKEYARLRGIERITAIWQPHKYSRTINNINGFVNCFNGVDNLIILPVWAAYEDHIDIDFNYYFSNYSPIIADKIERSGPDIKLLKNDDVLDIIDSGIVVGFSAGDLTYQIRGNIS